MDYKHITHDDFGPFYNKDSQILILGSLPSLKSREEKFYYMNPSNRFFKTLALIFNEDEPKAVDERKRFLLKHKIALFDVIKECDIKGSSDSSIKNAKANDLSDILKKSNIKAIFTTGKKAYNLYQQYIGNDCIYLPSSSSANRSISQEQLTIAYKKILDYLY